MKMLSLYIKFFFRLAILLVPRKILYENRKYLNISLRILHFLTNFSNEFNFIIVTLQQIVVAKRFLKMTKNQWRRLVICKVLNCHRINRFTHTYMHINVCRILSHAYIKYRIKNSQSLSL